MSELNSNSVSMLNGVNNPNNIVNPSPIAEDDDEIDLVPIFFALLKKWWLILLTAACGAVLAGFFTVFLMKPQYKSSMMLYVLSQTTSITSMADLQIGSALSDDFVVIAQSKPVIDAAIAEVEKNTGKTFTRKEVEGMLSVSNSSADRILVISATYSDPQVAYQFAKALGDATADQVAAITKSDPPTTVEYAEVENIPVGPNLKKNAAIGFVLGFLLLSAIIVIRCLINNNVKTEDELEKYFGVPTLVVIPIIEKNEGRKKRRSKSKSKSNDEDD